MEKRNIRDVNLLFLVDVAILIMGFTVLILLFEFISLPLQLVGVDSRTVVDSFVGLVEKNHLVAMLISQGMLLIPIVIFLYNRKKHVQNIIRMKRINIINLLLLTVLTYSLIPVMTFINMVSMVFVKNEIADKVDNVISKYPIILALIFMAIIPAFVEEILCRGIIYNTHATVSVKKGVILSGILFGVLHCNFNQFAYAFFMGIVFALIIEATDSTLATIFSHFIINANSIVLAYISNKAEVSISADTKLEYTAKDFILYGIIAVVAMVIAIVIYVNLAKYNKRWDLIKDEFKIRTDKEKKTLVDVSLIISIIVCVIYMIALEMV